MIIRWIKNTDHYIWHVDLVADQYNLWTTESAIDERIGYVRDADNVLLYFKGLGIQVAINDMPDYANTIHDIFNAVMDTKQEGHKFMIKDKWKEGLKYEWLELFELFKWQNKNMVDKFGGRVGK